MMRGPRPDPRGPMRRVIAAKATPEANVYELDCGHTASGAQHFALDRPGAERRCFQCGREELARWEASR